MVAVMTDQPKQRRSSKLIQADLDEIKEIMVTITALADKVLARSEELGEGTDDDQQPRADG